MTRAKPRNMLANCIYSRNRMMGSCARNFCLVLLDADRYERAATAIPEGIMRRRTLSLSHLQGDGTIEADPNNA